jgi:hypothetical protein
MFASPCRVVVAPMFTSAMRILVVGDGDFTFSRALVRSFAAAESSDAVGSHCGCGGGSTARPGRSLYATSLDTVEELRERYPGVAEACLQELVAAGATVMHGVDASSRATLGAALRGVMDERSLHAVVFNFPHRAGKSRIHLSRALIAGVCQFITSTH